MKKYFDFKGTINGNQYLVRPLLGWLLGFAAAFVIGFLVGAITGSEDAAGAVALLTVYPALIWLGLSTTVKRARALSKQYDVALNAIIILFVPFASLWALFADSDVIDIINKNFFIIRSVL